ncbi:MAG: hypothetical protein Q9174_006614 [Haloplaca sp. 1 TL-2023]
MASPPYRSPAGSPPYPSSAALPNPKKRPSLSLTSHQPAAKRRKPTNASQTSTPATSHPLRQTSFPPEESAIDLGERSPSVESDGTAHQSVAASATGKPLPKKRGRKRKSDMTSVVSGDRPAAKDTKSEAGPLAEEAEEEEDEADAEDGAQGDQDKEQKRKDKANMAVLVSHFNDDQTERYEAMRRNKFRKETVRKIVNQTLSQSVPPSIVTGISGYTKTMLGMLIERARDIQEQNAAAAAAYPSPPLQAEAAGKAIPASSTNQNSIPSATSFASSATLPLNTSFGNQSHDALYGRPGSGSDTDRPPEINHNDIFGAFSSPPRSKEPPLPTSLPDPNSNPLDNMDIDSNDPTLLNPTQDTAASNKPARKRAKIDTKQLGPLLPDDFREAWRRFKRDGESAGIGQGAMSLMGTGVRGSAGSGRMKGKRLFG